MKLKKIIGRLMSYFDADLKTQRKEKKALHRLLKQLKHKEKELCDQLAETESAEKRDELQTKLDVVRAQRSKGVVYLQTERKQRQEQTIAIVENSTKDEQ